MNTHHTQPFAAAALRALVVGCALLVGTAAVAAEDEIQHRVDRVPLDSDDGGTWGQGARKHVFGILALEAAMQHLRRPVGDVVMVSADYEPHFELADNPDHATPSSSAALGQGQLVVRRERVIDGTTLASERVSDHRKNTKGGRICATAASGDHRDLTLEAFDVGTRRPVGARDQARRNRYPSVLFIDGVGDRVAMTPLAPGESITIIELIEPIDGQPKRRVTLRRTDRVLSIFEGEGEQTICVDMPGVLPAEPRPHATAKEIERQVRRSGR